jgi:hypothetical protein
LEAKIEYLLYRLKSRQNKAAITDNYDAEINIGEKGIKQE